MNTVSLPTAAAVCFLHLAPSAAPAQDRTPGEVTAKGRTVLFADDHDVLYRSGTRRVPGPVKRHADQPLLGLARPWEVAVGYTSVHRDPTTGKYQLWYQAYAGNRAGERRLKCVVCYAESDDGVRFERPELDLFRYKGEKTNIVLVGNGGYGDRYCCSVLVDPDEKDPGRRYKMAYYDWSAAGGREEPGLHVAFSPDGIHWTKHGEGPLLRTHYGARGAPPFADESPYQETPVPGRPARRTWSYPLTTSDVIDVFWDPVRRVFVLVGKFWIDGPDGGMAWKNAIARSESKDFVHWSKPRLVLAPDDKDAPHVEFHGAPAFYHKGRYFALTQVLDRRAGLATDIELMTSRDGFAWERPFRDHFFLARSKPGRFDSRTILTNSTPVVLGDEIRFYYGAANVAPLGGVRSEPGERSGVGMASVLLDRFAGLRPVPKGDEPAPPRRPENVGQVTLQPLDFGGCTGITVNADATAGAVRVELLTSDGYRVRGFSREDAVAVAGDGLRHRAAWQGRTLDRLPPGEYLVRLHLENATVYAVSFE